MFEIGLPCKLSFYSTVGLSEKGKIDFNAVLVDELYVWCQWYSIYSRKCFPSPKANWTLLTLSKLILWECNGWNLILLITSRSCWGNPTDNLSLSFFPMNYSLLHLCFLFLLISGNGLGIRVVGGKEIPGSSGEIGAYIAKVLPGGNAEQTGKLIEGKLNALSKSGSKRVLGLQ